MDKQTSAKERGTGPLEFTEPLCHQCAHWRGDLTCSAFPKGIPRGVFTNELDHHPPIEGDNGVQFVQK